MPRPSSAKPRSRRPRRKASGTANGTDSSAHKAAKRLLLSTLVLGLVACGCFLGWRYYGRTIRTAVRRMQGETFFPPQYNIRGLDISHYQGSIDWGKLARGKISGDPVSFVIIKATQGTTIFDEDFNYNFYHARRNGIIRGAYHFFSPESNAAEQAKFFLHLVQLDAGDLPPVLDIETKGELSEDSLRIYAKTWLDAVEAHYGTPPIIYSSYKFHQKYLSTPEFARYPFWIAHYYVPKLEYSGAWHFWQHTDCGRIDGIKGNVDCNIFNGTKEQLLQLTLKNNQELNQQTN